MDLNDLRQYDGELTRRCDFKMSLHHTLTLFVELFVELFVVHRKCGWIPVRPECHSLGQTTCVSRIIACKDRGYKFIADGTHLKMTHRHIACLRLPA